ncbi:CRISPR-associated endonuclease Cas3'' [Thermodesulfovibrio yellowstonii]|uniref:CRISPR-associated endonuclease Cas3 n=1 Tax=Thermodesulfovibrio yellowstonii TaxID=28262 RepID=A0A9W6GGM5_9BACT|nr:CRISPR-associated endonuclease Cas3'' [Thermodesulfovibrio islandicus]GLI53638.1 CRISPR-associated endonuclease Cas3'' [Thermodesulfovibrio islandicus]
MPAVSLYSAPEEGYSEHIQRCKEKFEYLFPLFESSISRVMQMYNLKDAALSMILFHDLGKLTKKWQDNVGTNKKLPSHATIGAAYIFKILPEGLREPISFAIAIHHTDRGLLGENIERPDVQAILEGIVDYDGKIIWHEEAYKLADDLFPEKARTLTVNDLKEMARGLRIWARGCGLLEQHQRRMQASLTHHILKLCDISAATDRKEYHKKDDQDYYGGWLMVENIRDYVENIKKRGKEHE